MVNPKATSTSPRVTDVLVHALSDEIALDVTVTERPGHATELARQARADGLDIVITLGGDGVIHEAVNGLLDQGPGPQVPLLATIPGGSGNVFARALGLTTDAVEATGQVLEAVRAGRSTAIGLGRANGTWFIANAGLGLDAEVIAAMTRQRQRGHAATPWRYLLTTLTQLFAATDRREPHLRVTRAGSNSAEHVYLAIVQNTSPWTFLGPWPIEPCPNASFDAGLDLFAIHSLDTAATVRIARRMLMHSVAGSTRRSITVWHDQAEFVVHADRPIPMQIDGEAVGDVLEAHFEAVPHALNVVL